MIDNFTDITRVTTLDLERQAEVLSGPLLLAFDITNKCNLRCLHCYNRSGGRLARHELNADELLDVGRQIKALNPMVACLCGGEPLLRGALLYRLFDMLVGDKNHVNMVSNGYFITRTVARDLKKAGAYFVQISVDGSQAQSHDRMRGVDGSFNRAIRAIEYLVENDIRVGVAFAPTKFNIHEFPQYLELMKQLGVTEVHVQPLMPLGECLANAEELLPTEEDYRWLVDLVYENTYKGTPNFAVEWGDPIEHFVRFGDAQRGLSLYVDINSEGYLRVSPYLPLYFGQLRKHSLSDYWRAGYKTIWTLDLVYQYASRIRSVRDLMNITPSPFYGEFIYKDLIDDAPLASVSNNPISTRGGNNGIQHHSSIQ